MFHPERADDPSMVRDTLQYLICDDSQPEPHLRKFFEHIFS